MRRGLAVLTLAGIALLTLSSAGLCEDDIYYARCNLKVLKDTVSWLNWQASPSLIPAGTKLKLAKAGDGGTLTNPETGATYRLDAGAAGDQYIEKFVSKKAVNLKSHPEDVQAYIRSGMVKVGMTKAQVYLALGPPVTVGGAKTNTMTYEDIMNGTLWVYARKRMSKNIGVAFDPVTGKVSRTEGI